MARELETQAQLAIPKMPARFTAKRMLVAILVIAIYLLDDLYNYVFSLGNRSHDHYP